MRRFLDSLRSLGMTQLCAFALRTNVAVGSQNLATYTYADVTNLLTELDYGNGDEVKYEYDIKGRLLKQTYEDSDTVTYTYDNNGALATVTDSATGIKTTYYYDFTDRMMKYVESGTNYSHSVGYEYDNINNLTATVETINGVDRTTSYTYDEDNRVISKQTGNTKVTYAYDNFSRVTTQTTYNGENVVLTETFTYNGNSSQIRTYATTAGGTTKIYTYEYDGNGNITSIDDGTYTTTYHYDSANQLIREDSEENNITILWNYDNAGNILGYERYESDQVEPGCETMSQSYGYATGAWKDVLTSIDTDQVISDEIGNITAIRNDMGIDILVYTWQHGRQLASIYDYDLDETWTFTYNADGLRTKRTDGTKTYNYIYNGSQLTGMTVDGHTLYFSYDAAGTPMSVNYDGAEYYYTSNLQGDVTGIVNASGATVVTYTYSAWGEQLSCTGSMASTLGAINPLRYRGYVYDQETSLYYLQSRYYDPYLCRFINADAFASTGQGLLGNNMFAYCNNNPINSHDPAGTYRRRLRKEDWEDIWEIGATILKVFGYTLTGELLELAVNGSNNTYNYAEGSYAAKLIASDEEFISAVRKDFNENYYGIGGYKSGKLSYEFPVSQGDLGAALHWVNYSYSTLYYSGKEGMFLKITVTDTFDFTEFKNPFKQESIMSGLLWTANDIAFISSIYGVINPVPVKITVIVPVEP